jgi:hypothetical protein
MCIKCDPKSRLYLLIMTEALQLHDRLINSNAPLWNTDVLEFIVEIFNNAPHFVKAVFYLILHSTRKADNTR